MKKILWFDTETTGTDPSRHGLLTISGMVEIDGKIMEEFDFRTRPFPDQDIKPEALLVNGLTVHTIAAFPEPRETYAELARVFDRHINRYDKTDKFYPAGHNVRFDIDFLKQFFVNNGNQYFGSYLKYQALDTMCLAHGLFHAGVISPPDFKLATLCAYFNIPLDAHKSMDDIRASRELAKKMFDLIKGDRIGGGE